MEERQRKYLEKLRDRHAELHQLLASEDIMRDIELLRKYNKEVASITELVNMFSAYEKLEEECGQAEDLLNEDEKDVKALAMEEVERLETELFRQEELIINTILSKYSTDDRNIYLEIRAGAGGNEAAIFGGDLFSMYQRYAEKRGWDCDIIGLSHSEQGGYKQAVIYLSGKEVYGNLKFESGTHRVQRVPKTEAKGRLHTSTCTVAIIPEASNSDEIEIKKSDIRIDTFRASGAGGQHVNKTDSAVRITHLPSGIVVECQEERSQHRNKEKAMSVLQAKLLQEETRKQEEETSELRKSLVGRGDRAEKIRTYNYPQNRVTDHRIGLTLHSLDNIIAGDMDSLIDPLKTEEKNIIASGGKI